LELLATFAVCAAIIVLRNPAAVFRAEFWAEDATEYFFGALTLGLRSIGTPVWGFHCLAARIIAALATAAPVLWTPSIYSLACLLINAGVTSYLVRDGFSWILPSRPWRMVAALILAVGPGTSEVFLNLCNLHSVLAWFMLLLLVEQPFQVGRVRFAAIVVVLFSSVHAVLWIPVIALLWFRTRQRPYLALLLCIVPVILLNGLGTHATSGEANLRDYGHVSQIPRILVENVFLRLFFMPFLGDSLTASLMKEAWTFWAASAAVAAAALYLGSRNSSVDRGLLALLGLAFACGVASFGPIVVSRAYAAGQLVRSSGVTWWSHRYAYLPGMTALLLWFSLIGTTVNRRPRDLKAAAALLALFLLALNNLVEWNSGYRRDDLHWPQAAPVLQDALNRRRRGELREPVVVRNIRWVHPAGWRPAHGELTLVIAPR
jgi:hypothetical protein